VLSHNAHSSPLDGATTFYCDFMLSCRPMRLDNGQYQARVAITSVSADRTRSQRFLDLEAFDSEESAIQRARRVGMEWIDANIGPARIPAASSRESATVN
jgi:hypothetical protein